MLSQPLGEADLVVPREVLFRVLRKLDVIRRVCVYKVIRLERELFKIATLKIPIGENVQVLGKAPFVVDGLVAPERHIVFAFTIESAQTVVASAIQVIEKARRFFTLRFSLMNECVEARSASVKVLLLIFHLDRDGKSLLEPAVEIYGVGINVVDESFLGRQTERNGKAAAQRLNKAARAKGIPESR